MSSGRYLIEKRNPATGEWQGVRYCQSRHETDVSVKRYMIEYPTWHLRAIEMVEPKKNKS